jgi:hypothetical protein
MKSDDLKTFWENGCLRKVKKGKRARVAAKQRERETRKTGAQTTTVLKNTIPVTE